MNILLAVVVMAVVLAQGAESARVPRSAAGHRVRQARFAGRKAGLRRGDRVSAVADTRSTTWDSSTSNRHRPNREIDLTYLRDGETQFDDAAVTSEGKFEVGDIGVLRTRRRSSRRSSRATSPRKRGTASRDLLLAVNGEVMTQPRS
jgi:hypothetical protein